MIRLALGFPGEKFICLPLPTLDLLKDNPLIGDLYIHNLGYFSKAQHHYINRPKGCEEYLIIYCTEGCGKVNLNDKQYTLSANQFIILPPNIKHQYEADNENPWTIYWVHFLGSKAMFFAENFDSPHQILPSQNSRIEDRLKLFDEIYQTLNNGFEIENLHYANLCFAHFLATFLHTQQFRNAKKKSEYSNSIINHVVYYMNENTGNSLSINDFSSYIGYSTSYFYNKFMKETGFSPMDYYTRLKINKASMLLVKTDLKISQIAHQLGYSDPLYFSRIFSKFTGLSPINFRKRELQI